MESPRTRATPETPLFDVLIIGSGFAGLGMAIRLQQAGITNSLLIEKDPEIGGTWWANRYPGAACDVESHLYSYSFELNPDWSRSFSGQKEILDYTRSCARKYGLEPRIQVGTEAVSATFASGVWSVRTKGGETLRARVLVAGTGGLSRPAFPDIPGLSDFRGTVFHTARWRNDVSLDGKRVAVIGTGASAIQVVPSIASRVSKLSVFQRTPPWILPRHDREISDFEKSLFRTLPVAMKLARLMLYLRHEAFALGFFRYPAILRGAEWLGRTHLRRQLPDHPELREKLAPRYRAGCKRILLADDYYPTFARENVELVTEEIDRITARGILTRDGHEREFDVLVLATGFQASEASAPFEVKGRAGTDLAALWKDGPQAHLGTTVAGFPNFFILVGPNTGLGHSSMIYMIESQLAYVLQAIRRVLSAGPRASLEVKEEAQARSNDWLVRRLPKTIWATGCVSWYLTRSGRNTTLWPGFTFDFRRRLRRLDLENYFFDQT